MSDLPEIRNGASNGEISYSGDAISHFQRQVSVFGSPQHFRFVIFVIIGIFSNDVDDGKENVIKAIFRLAKQQLCTRSTLFCTFLCRRCAATKWNCQIFFFRGRKHKSTAFLIFFFQLTYSPLEFKFRKIYQHLTNWTTWNKSNEFWNSVNSLFKTRFCHCCR